MQFKKDLTVLTTSTVADPATVEMKLCYGTIFETFIQFPAGCSGRVWAQIWLNGYQLIPWERGEWIRGDDHTFFDHGKYSTREQPRIITVKGYADGCTYEHTIQVGIQVDAGVVEVETWSPYELLDELGLLEGEE